jgi:hypothetical protein
VSGGRLLVIGDSLTFHGPRSPELLTHPGLYPNVAGRLLGADVDVVARLGWTARDAWWALTKDPHVYSVLLPRAGAVVLGVGGSDQLPASLPGYLRDGIAYLRPGPLRRAARRAYHRAHPIVVRATGGRRRSLPQRVTDAYLSRCVAGIRYFRPGVPIVALVPPPYDAAYHAHVRRLHPPAAAAARAWGRREGVPMVPADAIVAPYLAAGALNPDGMHWSWAAHAEVGAAIADAVRAAGWTGAEGNRAEAGTVSPT